MIGKTLGHYRLVEKIGAGGMGEVYRASDTRLDRTVAIKVLPAHVAADPDVRQRFEHEARTISSLNHPHICTLHDFDTQDGVDFLVMEHLEGETLAGRLTKGALPPDQVLRYAIQIASALDKAHRQGVVHRDLKPGNIMLTKSGAKLLDFGLAKLKTRTAPGLRARAPSGPDAGREAESLSALPTQQAEPLTEKGTILGTFQYMAPEQLERKDADARTDLFTFGAVVYEMATGQKAFEGASEASLISAILERHPPPISSRQPVMAPALDYVVKTCLAKDPEERWQTAGDLKRQLIWIAEGGSQPTVTPGPPARQRGRQRAAWAAAGLVLGLAVVGLAVWSVRPSSQPPPRPVTRFAVNLPGDQLLGRGRGISTPMALSPDGALVVYSAQLGGDRPRLYLRALDEFEARLIPGTEGALDPFFSPDGQWVGFFAESRLQKVALAGGAPQTICLVPATNAGASWGPDDTIIFATAFTSTGLFRVSAGGGMPEALTTPNFGEGEASHRLPHILPNGTDVLFTIETVEGTHIAVLSLESGEWWEVEGLAGAADAWYLGSGHLIYSLTGSLLAVPFDPARHELVGSAIPVLDGVYTSPASLEYFTLSRTGSLAYAPAPATTAESTVLLVDLEGRATPLRGDPARYWYPRFSPDGTRMAIAAGEIGSRDVWVSDVERGTRTRLTVDGENTVLIWTPDGERITFASNRTGSFNLYWRLADGSGEAEALLTSEYSQFPGSWSPDGRLLAFYEINPTTGRDIWVLPVEGDRTPSPFLVSAFSERSPRFAPDGRWLAYVSDESGPDEVYVQPYPGPGGKITISTGGGQEPVWSADGRELFYRHGDQMMVVAVETEPTFNAEAPRVLFEERYDVSLGGLNQNYDVSPDGQRFVMIRSEQEAALTQFHVVQNWVEELKERVPVN